MDAGENDAMRSLLEAAEDTELYDVFSDTCTHWQAVLFARRTPEADMEWKRVEQVRRSTKPGDRSRVISWILEWDRRIKDAENTH